MLRRFFGMATETDAKHLAERITSWLPKLDGAPRFWGWWVGGKHFDFGYSVTACDGEGDLLRIYSKDDGTIFVWRARGVALRDDVFSIADADRVRWEWRGEFFEFEQTADGVTGTRNRERTLHADPSQPAVELIAFTANNIRRY